MLMPSLPYVTDVVKVVDVFYVVDSAKFTNFAHVAQLADFASIVNNVYAAHSIHVADFVPVFDIVAVVDVVRAQFSQETVRASFHCLGQSNCGLQRRSADLRLAIELPQSNRLLNETEDEQPEPLCLGSLHLPTSARQNGPHV
ncbi:unnamed protein product [Protopolystoma xenopodis]|uniref:Uncharacterized protein n=1 Tax=Protopolystoma xenopodis TaxID=117903 RepID=A0A3S5ACA1_9PLAT|nr:unnamed protein product [Protopolystoma xenopodis]